MYSEYNKIASKEPETKNKEDVLLGSRSVVDFTKDGYKVLMEAIRHSNSLPNGRDWNFYSTHDAFNKIVNDEGDKLMSLINSVLHKNDIDGNIRNRVLEEKTELIVEANDVILERVANNIDEMNGIKKTVYQPVVIQTVSAHLPINGSWNRVNSATFSVSSTITTGDVVKDVNKNSIHLLTAKNILRPQKFFKNQVNNSRHYPWEPRIKEKPNSLKPLAIFLEESENGQEFSHPYEYELERFMPMEEQLQKEEVIKPKLIEDTPLIEIDNPEQLDDLVNTLRNCKEFAIDLEHHSYRSFMGITCLMQISTRDKDYLIDTLALRDKLYVLNEVFTKPTIIKVLHGADLDIMWLQRDLSLYVVNMFDTHQAAKKLEYSGLSLAYLIKRFCNFVPNKQFQLADWRIRPLPKELKSYAREDTHYLIYIYQMMKNELLKKANGQDNLLRSVIQTSTVICKKRFIKPIFREDSHLDFYRRCKRLFDNRQLYALKELYNWRDQISRDEDESCGYILPNHMLLQISETLPREMQGILACCNPIPPLVRSNLLDLHKIILKAREQPIEKPILKEDTRARGTTTKMSKLNVDSPLHCPHDLTKSSEFRDDLPTLLESNINFLLAKLNENINIEETSSVHSVLNTSLERTNKTKKDFDENFTFLSPFQRYKQVKPFIQAEEERLAGEESKNDKGLKDKELSTDLDDNRTDEQRINSIREHFLTLAQKTLPSFPTQSKQHEMGNDVSLIQLGGTKKRKRHISRPYEDIVDINPTHQLAENELHTSISNMNPKQSGKNNKRKSSDPAEGSPNKMTLLNIQTNNQQRTKKNKKRNKQKLKTNTNNQNLNSQCMENDQGVHDIQELSNERVDYQVHSNYQIQGNKGGHYQQQPNKNRGRKNWNRGGRQQVMQKTHDQEFTPYDYSSVDFRQFQGGAGGVEKPKEPKSAYRNKGKKKGGNRGQNKSFTYTKGRGR